MIAALLGLLFMGVAIISIAIAIVVTHFLLKGIEILIPLRHIVHYQTTNDNECETGQTDNRTNRAHVAIYPLNIRRYDLYDIIRSRIGKMPCSQVRQQYPSHKPRTDTKEYHRYINRYCPRPTQHPFPIPVIKHIHTIVNKLHRRVNQSGKEPPGATCITGLDNKGIIKEGRRRGET
jgi:hypothetical protein